MSNSGLRNDRLLGTIACNDSILPFTKTSLSENTFNAWTQLDTRRTKTKNCLLYHDDLRLAFTNFDPDIKSLCKNLQNFVEASEQNIRRQSAARFHSVKIFRPLASQKIFFLNLFSCIFILLSRESYQCAIRARLGVASHLSTTPRWGNPTKCLSQRHNK